MNNHLLVLCFGLGLLLPLANWIIGANLVNWLAEFYPHLPRESLLGLGQMLMNRGVMTSIKTDQKYFRDSKTTLFRFKVSFLLDYACTCANSF